MFEVLTAYAAVPPDEERARSALVELFACLSQPTMRTEPNCVAVDLFFALELDRLSVTMLPRQFVDFLSEPLGLHDTVTAPEIADNFGTTPEELLVKARRL